MTLHHWPAGVDKVFLAPAYYADNPTWPSPSLTLSTVVACDAQGDTLPAPETRPGSEGIGGLLLHFHPATTLIRYRIDSDTSAPARAGLALPKILPGRQAIDGACLFLLPVASSIGYGAAALDAHALARLWRTPMRLRLQTEVPPGMTLLGLAADEDLPHAYALMFARGALVPTRARPGETRGGARLAYTLNLRRGPTPVAYYALTSDTVGLATLATRLPTYLAAIENALGPLPTPFLAIGEAGPLGGLEGWHGYWFGKPHAGNHEVHLHELIHLYVGLHLGDFDLPWFKEGVTTYLAQWLALRAGYMKPDAWQAYVLAIAAEGGDTAAPIHRVSHGDETSRLRYYRPLDPYYADGPDQGWYTLVYQKGLQTALLLDAWLLERSRGEADLSAWVRALHEASVREGKGGFTRKSGVALMAELAGTTLSEAEAEAARLFDTVGPWPRASLEQAFEGLQRWRGLEPVPLQPVASAQSS